MDRREIKQSAGRLIQKVLDRALSARDCLAQWPSGGDLGDETLDCAFEALNHYESDEDIRQRDPAYAQRQREELQLLVDCLLNDQPLPPRLKRFLTPIPLNPIWWIKEFLDRRWKNRRRSG